MLRCPLHVVAVHEGACHGLAATSYPVGPRSSDTASDAATSIQMATSKKGTRQWKKKPAKEHVLL